MPPPQALKAAARPLRRDNGQLLRATERFHISPTTAHPRASGEADLPNTPPSRPRSRHDQLRHRPLWFS
ncbi:hypothetical protein [Streptomyces sp. TBY4]|uniref:hypothetical protein n=1 Tax=Streptomyces sp. TBY4 TaxID=2962030 RepID=UPI0020B7A8D4|nr:hypothetical protein [Streptomyces sp. TBY4]MCP3757051.1 hypothetical protein [Streptomyces sp. TBY4]